jgi:hypothetical protein
MLVLVKAVLISGFIHCTTRAKSRYLLFYKHFVEVKGFNRKER